MRRIIITLAAIATVGTAVKLLGLGENPVLEQTVGQWCETFNDERDYYYGGP